MSTPFFTTMDLPQLTTSGRRGGADKLMKIHSTFRAVNGIPVHMLCPVRTSYLLEHNGVHSDARETDRRLFDLQREFVVQVGTLKVSTQTTQSLFEAISKKRSYEELAKLFPLTATTGPVGTVGNMSSEGTSSSTSS